MARKSFNYHNPDGTLRALEIVERLPDGTRVLEDGSRISTSNVRTSDGGYEKLIEMASAEYRAWNDKAMERVGRGMSELYKSL